MPLQNSACAGEGEYVGGVGGGAKNENASCDKGGSKVVVRAGDSCI